MSDENSTEVSSAEITAPEGSPSELTTETSEISEIPRYKIRNATGDEIEVDIEELKRGYQRDDSIQKAAQRKFQEAAHQKKQVAQLLNLLKTNPAEALSRLGVDVNGFVHERVNHLVDEVSLTPEQKERRELEKRLADYEAKEKEHRTKQEQEAHRIAYEEAAKNVSTQIQSALETINLPKTQDAARRVAQYMYQAHKRQIELSAVDAAQLVKQDYENDIKSLIGGMSEEEISKYLGQDITKKLIKKSIAATTSRPAGSTPPPSTIKKKEAAPIAKEFDRTAWRDEIMKKALR